MSRTAILRQRHPSLTPARAFRQPASVSLPLRSHVIAHRHVLTAACLLRAVGTVHGNADQVVPPAESFKMYEELHSRGAHAELHTLAQAPHGEKKHMIELPSVSEWENLLLVYRDRSWTSV